MVAENKMEQGDAPSEQSRSVQFAVDVETTTTTKTRDGDPAAGSSELEKSITIHDFDDEALPSGTAHTMSSSDSRHQSRRRRSSATFRDSLRNIGSSNSLRRLSKSASMMSVSVLEPPTGLSTFTSSSIVVNYISAGYVLLPWAFAQAGTLLSSIAATLVALQSYITATYLLETCARAEALRNARVVGGSAEGGNGGTRVLPRQYSMAIRTNKFELSELCLVFFGPRTRDFFTFTSAVDLYGITWTFAVVFASAFQDEYAIRAGSMDDYLLYLLIFACVTVPLTCVPIIDQLFIQMIFLAARTIMVIMMVVTLSVAYSSSDTAQFGTQEGPSGDVPLADFSNLVTVIQTAIFSTAFQFSVPGMGGVTRDKKKLLGIFQTGVTYIYITNLVLALVTSYFFGKDSIDQSNNLNWLEYHGGTTEGTVDSTTDGRALWATFVSQYIVMFAAIDGLAVFPLCAVSLGEILMGAFYGDRVHECNDDWRKRTAFRLLGSIPQLVGAAFVSDLGVLAKYVGIFTLLSYTTCPCVLFLKSQQTMKDNDLPTKTYYHTAFSAPIVAYGLLFLSALLIVGVVIDSSING